MQQREAPFGEPALVQWLGTHDTKGAAKGQGLDLLDFWALAL